MSLWDEISEQEDRLYNLIRNQKKNAQKIGRLIREKKVPFIFLAARGSSDNAGRYANYLWGGRNRIPLALATPSLFSMYQTPPNLRDALVVGISQSGQSPDIVGILEEGRRQGCPTLAITNESNSPLAQTADFVFDIQTGPELAIAATKTYTSELTAIAMLSAAINDSKDQWNELSKMPGWIGKARKDNTRIEEIVQRYLYLQNCIVMGRGYNYASAFEWALKLKELTYVEAEPYSSADFQHGPVAMVEKGFPIFSFLLEGKVSQSILCFLKKLVVERQAELVVISNMAEGLQLTRNAISVPRQIPEWLSPIVSIIPAHLFTYHLTKVKGIDPDKPRNIQKVTETR
jgi:glutamine---fructose-6-phosphate transaminase (isomerizing)